MKSVLFSLLLIGIYNSSLAQVDSKVLMVDLEYDISLPPGKAIKEILIPRRWWEKKSKRQLLLQCEDSTKALNGNCFKVTYFDEKAFVVKKGIEYYIRGIVYNLDEGQIVEVIQEIENYSPPKIETEETKRRMSFNDTSKVSYKLNTVFQLGGESRLTLFPKFNILRVHQRYLVQPYYGLEFGIHPVPPIGYFFSFSGIIGIELKQFVLESSISHFRTSKLSDGDDGYTGPYSQNLLNLKLGYSIKSLTIKLGVSLLTNEIVPDDNERIPILDLGKINNQIFGIEIQYRIN